MNNQYFNYPFNDGSNMKYRKKVKLLRARIKKMVFENAALCDQVAQVQENILCVKEERRFLLKKLIEHENELDIQNNIEKGTNAVPDSFGNDLTIVPVKKKIKKRSNSEASNKSKTVVNKPGGKLAKQKRQKQQQQQMVQIPLDANGHPAYPFSAGTITIQSLGDIVIDRLGYHNEKWIYPVGYTATRIYGSVRDPLKKCLYTCKILDNGDSPLFEISSETDPYLIITSANPDVCHTTLLQYINSASADIRNIIEIQPQGEWFFGLAHPTIMTLIQNFVNSTKCSKFKGFNIDPLVTIEKENDPALTYEALQRHISVSVYHTVPEIKEEPPDELLDQSESSQYLQ